MSGEPLTAEEERMVRFEWERRLALAQHRSDELIPRLLATLDADRASRPSEKEAALREALERAAANNHDEGSHGGYAGPASFRDCADTACMDAAAALRGAVAQADGGEPGPPMVTIRRSLYESLARLAEKALEPTGAHRKIDGGYCTDCQGQCLRDWLTRPPLPPKPVTDRQWDGS